MAILFLLLFIAFIFMSCRYTWWRPIRSGVAILLYHHIGNPPKDMEKEYKKLYVSREDFLQQMNFLKENGYSVVDFKTLIELPKNGIELSDRACVITFDDGYSDIFSNALPVMEKLGFSGVVFLDVSKIGKDEYNMLSWEQIQILRKKGWEIGSHTMHHSNLDKLSNEECEIEIIESKRRIEQVLKEEISVFAYPYGKGVDNPNLHRILKSAGYRLACAIRRDKQSIPIETPFSVKRVLVRGDDNMMDFRLSLRKGRSRC